MTSMMSSDFHLLVSESFHKRMVQIDKVVSEKIWFAVLYVHDLGPRSRNDLDLQYSHTFIYMDLNATNVPSDILTIVWENSEKAGKSCNVHF